jgi:ectoine hydroxylase-related dioxygenase (phytanoyl-CoA dioxygenase family)
MRKYGQNNTGIPNNSDAVVKQLIGEGLAVLQSIIEVEALENLRKRTYQIYDDQAAEFGIKNMERIGELNVLRCPLYCDELFFLLLENERILEITQNYLGEHFILHLQNAIINTPQKEHHQTAWHRDLPYQNHLISRPLALNVFLCLTDFTKENGATHFIERSHKMEDFPSDATLEKSSFQIEGRAGDVILFDSMMIHRAGINQSSEDRIGLNHVLVKPLLKQQIDLPSLFNGKYRDHPVRSKLLGYRFDVPKTVLEFRLNRLKSK